MEATLIWVEKVLTIWLVDSVIISRSVKFSFSFFKIFRWWIQILFLLRRCFEEGQKERWRGKERVSPLQWEEKEQRFFPIEEEAKGENETEKQKISIFEREFSTLFKIEYFWKKKLDRVGTFGSFSRTLTQSYNQPNNQAAQSSLGKFNLSVKKWSLRCEENANFCQTLFRYSHIVPI